LGLIAIGAPVFEVHAQQLNPKQSTSDNVRGGNNALLNVYQRFLSNPASPQALRLEAGNVIKDRAAALQNLISENPSQALALALADDALAGIAAAFPDSAGQLESNGEWAGELEYLVIDNSDLKTSQSVTRLKTAVEVLDLHFDSEPAGLESGIRLKVHGIRLGTQVAAVGEPASTMTVAEAGAMCTPIGQQRALVLLVTFPGTPAPAIAPSSVSNIFFGTSGRSLNTYWNEASYGATSATGDVLGWLTLNASYTCDQYASIQNAALQVADSLVDLTQYSRIFIIFPSSGCSWSGLSTVGCGSLSTTKAGTFIASTSWLISTYFSNPDQGVMLSTHEAGHGLGLNHARSRGFAPDAVGAPGTTGTLTEYGSSFSTMGYWNLGHYDAPHKAQLGWISEGAGYQTISGNGSFSVQPTESSGSLRALRIPRGTSTNSWLWLEYRQPIGAYDSTLSSQVFTGGLLHLEDSITGLYTDLLDFTPSTSTFSDGALAAGRSWADPYTNLQISVNSATASALGVTVSYGPAACTTANPTVAISPQNPSANAGGSVTYTISVTDKDTSACAGRAFSLSSTAPGWSTTFSQSSLTLSPGGTASATMTLAVAPTITAATYGVNAVATNGSNAGVGSANVTVLPPCTAANPTVSISPPNPSVYPGSNVSYTVSVSNTDAANCASRSFSLTSTLPGWTTTFSPASVTIAPGAGASSTMTLAVASTISPATYSVNATAAGGSTTGTANAQVTVTTAPTSATRVNVALASNGAVATASSSYNSAYPSSAVNDGDRKGLNWGAGGGWNDATASTWPDWLEVDFNGTKTIDEVDVFTLQDNYLSPSDPTPAMTFSLYGLTDFQVQYLSGGQWITVPGGTVSGNNLVWRQVTFSSLTTTAIRVWVTGALAGYSRITEVEAYAPINVALASNGAVATASSSYSSAYPSSAVIDGDRKGLNWGAGGGWNDATTNAWPDWLEVDFNGTKTINEVDVFTLQDNYPSPSDPTPTMTFTQYGVTDFQVQYWTGSAWATVPGGTVSGNNLVWRQFTFSPLTTSAIRIWITGALGGYSRITEVEAYAPVNVALAANGGVATASSSYSSAYPSSSVNDGDRMGLNWGAGGGWNDATTNSWPDWLEVDFNGTKTINEVDVFSLQDNYPSPSDPTPAMTFTLYGVTDFQVQYWTGSGWAAVPGASVSGNNLVWRQFTFSPLTTSAIRVWITGALGGYSRITEVEAYSQ
jgi:M6 family metalloprotease-like protein